MDKYYYSADNNEFIPVELEPLYREAGTFPDDAVIVADDISAEFIQIAPPGKVRAAGDDGMPEWVDLPPLTPEEIIAAAEADKLQRINDANDYMNSKQWPGKAAIGRLKGEELEQYGLWLDYLDALDAVKTASAPDIKWPTSPAVAAS